MERNDLEKQIKEVFSKGGTFEKQMPKLLFIEAKNLDLDLETLLYIVFFNETEDYYLLNSILEGQDINVKKCEDKLIKLGYLSINNERYNLDGFWNILYETL